MADNHRILLPRRWSNDSWHRSIDEEVGDLLAAGWSVHKVETEPNSNAAPGQPSRTVTAIVMVRQHETADVICGKAEE